MKTSEMPAIQESYILCRKQQGSSRESASQLSPTDVNPKSQSPGFYKGQQCFCPTFKLVSIAYILTGNSDNTQHLTLSPPNDFVEKNQAGVPIYERKNWFTKAAQSHTGTKMQCWTNDLICSSLLPTGQFSFRIFCSHVPRQQQRRPTFFCYT